MLAVHIVAVDAHAAAKYGKHGYDGLEGCKPAIEGRLTTSARYSEASGEHPVALLVLAAGLGLRVPRPSRP